MNELLSALPAVVILLDRDGVYRFLGGRDLALPGGHPGERVGRSIFAVRADRPDILASVRRALAGETILATREAGGVVWETRYVPLRGAAGAVIGVAYIAMDVAARARAEAAIEASEARLRAQYDAFPLPTCTWQHRDGDFFLIDRNVAADEFANGAIAARIGRSAAELYREYPEVRAHLARCFAGRATLRQEFASCGLELIITSVFVAPDLAVMHAEDVTERRRAEAAQRRSEREFQALIEQLPAVIYRAPAEASGATLFISAQAATLLGYPPACWTAAPGFWEAHLHPDDRAAALAAFAHGRATGLPVRAEYRFRLADGRDRWMRDEAALVHDEVGQPLYWQGLMIDITSRKRIEALLADQAAILERIAQDAPLDETLAALARAVEAAGEGMLVSILVLDEDGATLRPIAAPSIPASFLAATGRVVVAEGVGACGTAAFRRAPVVAADIATDPFWGAYRDLALASGLRACWSSPILTSAGSAAGTGHLLGTFAVYATAPREPDADDWRLIERSAGLAALAIERARSAVALRQAAESFASLFDATAEGMVIHEDGVIVAANRTYAAMLGREVAEVIGRDKFGFLTPETRERAVHHSRAGDDRPYEAVLVRRDGGTFPAELAGRPIRYQGRTARLVTVRDITARKAAEEALRAGEARLAASQALAHLGSWEEDLLTGEFAWSAEAFRICGFPPHSFRPTPERLAALLHPDDRERVLAARRAVLAGEAPREIDFRIVRPDGEVRVLHQQSEVIRDGQGRGIKRRGIILDVTERRVLEERLAHQATHDALTGLPNRALFLDRLGRALARARRGGGGCAVVFLDLDNFKLVNDSLGHDAGDRLLIALAGRLRVAVREVDTLARLGGDEFAALLDEVTEAARAAEIAERLARALEAPLALDGQVYRITASIGIVLSTPDHARPDDLLRDADIAMYRAKGDGGAGYALFDPAMQERLVERLALERDLRGALERQEFHLHYQPLIDLRTGRVAEVEALLRWRHPARGAIPADLFVPIAEETGLIAPLGRWVLREACRQARAWHDEGHPLTVAVNLSAREFQQADLVEVVAAALREAALAPNQLRLEITERLAMRDAAATIHTLAALRALGVQLAVDDFGTGYSSLAYLRRFPVDTLKIDRTFVADLGTNLEDTAIVEAMAGLGRTLGLSVVAEGTETAAQIAQLRALGCDLAQGYYFARPLDPGALGALLREGLGLHLPAAEAPPAPTRPATTQELRQRRADRLRATLLPTTGTLRER